VESTSLGFEESVTGIASVTEVEERSRLLSEERASKVFGTEPPRAFEERFLRGTEG